LGSQTKFTDNETHQTTLKSQDCAAEANTLANKQQGKNTEGRTVAQI